MSRSCILLSPHIQRTISKTGRDTEDECEYLYLYLYLYASLVPCSIHGLMSLERCEM